MEHCRSPLSVTRGTLLDVPHDPEETTVPLSTDPTVGPMSLTWVGHATVLIEVAGHRILTDPILTRRVAHLRRRRPVPQLEPVDTVLISHVHMDHLHVPSLRRVAPGAALVVPRGARSLVDGLG